MSPFGYGDCIYGWNANRVLTLSCLPTLIANFIFWLLAFVGSVALFFIIFGGIKLLTSQGDPGKVEGAKKTLTWAIVGLIVILMSVGIVRIIAQITGVSVGTLGLTF